MGDNKQSYQPLIVFLSLVVVLAASKWLPLRAKERCAPTASNLTDR